MFDKVKALCALIVLGSQQKEPSEAAGNVILKRQINNLKAELTLYKEIGKSRYEQNEPLKAKIKALEGQNSYLRETNNLMRETIEAQTEAMRAQDRADKAETPQTSSFDSKNT